jgi:hypothetical protein
MNGNSSRKPPCKLQKFLLLIDQQPTLLEAKGESSTVLKAVSARSSISSSLLLHSKNVGQVAGPFTNSPNSVYYLISESVFHHKFNGHCTP